MKHSAKNYSLIHNIQISHTSVRLNNQYDIKDDLFHL